MASEANGRGPLRIVPGSVRPGAPGNGWLRPTAWNTWPGTVRSGREIAVALLR